MVCSPSANKINPINLPPISGISGIALSPIQIPLPGIDLTAISSVLEDVLDAVSKLGLVFPSSTFKPNPGNFTKVILDHIAGLLSQIAPYLSLYNFFLAFLNLLKCVIEVLCSIPNPFKIASAMVKLFRDCIPPFIALFPFIALIMMILSLILLIIALIEYIIAQIIKLIEDIINNLKILGKGVALNDSEATLAAIQKLSNALCIIQNLIAIFTALAAIMAIIESLAKVAGGAICDNSDDSGCCGVSTCPLFISDGFIVSTGTLTYYPQIGIDLAAAISGLDPAIAALISIPPIRSESYQFVSTGSTTHSFREIITPVIDISTGVPQSIIFWPEGLSFDKNTSSSKIPYNIDLTLQMDPSVFVPDPDHKGFRTLVIKNAYVIAQPYIGVFNFANQIDPLSPVTGTLSLGAGLIYEKDGTTAFNDANGNQYNLNTLIHKPNISSNSLPVVDDAIVFENVQYTFRPNTGALLGYTLITAGCLPQVAAEKKVLNAIIVAEDVRAVVDKIPSRKDGTLVKSAGLLPNVAGTQDCMISALNSFRQDVSIENAAVFQARILTCLEDLKAQSVDFYCTGANVAVSQFKSVVDLDTTTQFITRPITVSVTLNDPNSVNVAKNMPLDCADLLENKIQGTTTLGKLSKFIYDGSEFFTAQLTTEIAGTGQLSISYDGKIFNNFVVGDLSRSSSIEEKLIDYTFVGSISTEQSRRDKEDVVNE